ncbi:MAG: RluA family pseudouridine synthase [Pseudomonadota bacterium]
MSVKSDEDGMRLDRWFKVHFPQLSHGRLSKLLRTGQVRVDGGRVKANERLTPGQTVRVPPISPDIAAKQEGTSKPRPLSAHDKAYFQSLVLYEDKHLYVLNKPSGLAVQGGSRTTRHIDGLLQGLAADLYDRPRLVHRLDRDTSGVLVIAKTRSMATSLSKLFQTRSVRKIYWALVSGVPRPEQGVIDKPLLKAGGPGDEKVQVARNVKQVGAQKAMTHYSVIDKAPPSVAWVSLKPVTGRQHQLRVHMQMIGHPIIGDPKYGHLEHDGSGEEKDEGFTHRLHLHARRVTFPHPKGGTVDVSAPVPGHMRESMTTCGFNPERYDVPEAGEEYDA